MYCNYHYNYRVSDLAIQGLTCQKVVLCQLPAELCCIAYDYDFHYI